MIHSRQNLIYCCVHFRIIWLVNKFWLTLFRILFRFVPDTFICVPKFFLLTYQIKLYSVLCTLFYTRIQLIFKSEQNIKIHFMQNNETIFKWNSMWLLWIHKTKYAAVISIAWHLVNVWCYFSILCNLSTHCHSICFFLW